MGKINKLIACFKALKINPKVEGVAAFEDRIVMQKTALILERAGIKLGFDSGLYIRGPYSPALTQELFKHKKEVEGLETSETLSKAEAQIIEKLKEKVDFNSATELEVIATYLFLKYNLRLEEDDAIKKLKEMKPFLSETIIFVGISKAKQLFD